jgi:16S rRNA (cytosine967-C5)-methyltransferase
VLDWVKVRVLARGAKDIPRRVALDVLQRVSRTASFSNLILPKELSARGVGGQDAGFVTDAVYGTLRWRGLLDAIIVAAARRDIEKIDSAALDVLRLGAFQVLFMRVPDYAAVSSSVELTRSVGRARLSGFVNAVIRKISQRDRHEWESIVVSRIPKQDVTGRLAVRHSHPEWIVRELEKSLEASGLGTADGLADVLAADNEAPDVTLVARPGLISREDLAAQLPQTAAVRAGMWSPYALRVRGVNPATIPAVQQGLAGVEDEGSQLAALAVVMADGGAGTESAWLDMCAGPGGKTALLGAFAAQRGVRLTANEPSAHRAELVRQNTIAIPETTMAEVIERDGREIGRQWPRSFDRILVDAPCSGLGALRRRPEARWTKKQEDIAGLTEIQDGLLNSALDAVRPGGVVDYVTCSPVLAETREIVDSVLARRGDSARMDAAGILRKVSPSLPLPDAGGDVQLFSHLHDTDQMFISLIRKAG